MLGSQDRSHWVPDESTQLCTACCQPFTTFRRKHHCRHCGRIFHSSCLRNVSGSIFQDMMHGRDLTCDKCFARRNNRVRGLVSNSNNNNAAKGAASPAVGLGGAPVAGGASASAAPPGSPAAAAAAAATAAAGGPTADAKNAAPPVVVDQAQQAAAIAAMQRANEEAAAKARTARAQEMRNDDLRALQRASMVQTIVETYDVLSDVATDSTIEEQREQPQVRLPSFCARRVFIRPEPKLTCPTPTIAAPSRLLDGGLSAEESIEALDISPFSSSMRMSSFLGGLDRSSAAEFGGNRHTDTEPTLTDARYQYSMTLSQLKEQHKRQYELHMRNRRRALAAAAVAAASVANKMQAPTLGFASTSADAGVFAFRTETDEELAHGTWERGAHVLCCGRAPPLIAPVAISAQQNQVQQEVLARFKALVGATQRFSADMFPICLGHLRRLVRVDFDYQRYRVVSSALAHLQQQNQSQRQTDDFERMHMFALLGEDSRLSNQQLRDITTTIAWKVATSINVADKDVAEHVSFLTVVDYPGCVLDDDEEQRSQQRLNESKRRARARRAAEAVKKLRTGTDFTPGKVDAETLNSSGGMRPERSLGGVDLDADPSGSDEEEEEEQQVFMDEEEARVKKQQQSPGSGKQNISTDKGGGGGGMSGHIHSSPMENLSFDSTGNDGSGSGSIRALSTDQFQQKQREDSTDQNTKSGESSKPQTLLDLDDTALLQKTMSGGGRTPLQQQQQQQQEDLNSNKSNDGGSDMEEDPDSDFYGIPKPRRLAAQSNVGAYYVIRRGVAFLGNIMHKAMRSKLVSHSRELRIMLCRGRLGFFAKFASMNYNDYLNEYRGLIDHAHQMLMRWVPDVIIVEFDVHYYFGDLLRGSGIPVVSSVGPAVIRQCAMALDCQTIDADDFTIEDTRSDAFIGKCGLFEVKTLGRAPGYFGPQRLVVLANAAVARFSTVVLILPKQVDVHDETFQKQEMVPTSSKVNLDEHEHDGDGGGGCGTPVGEEGEAVKKQQNNASSSKSNHQLTTPAPTFRLHKRVEQQIFMWRWQRLLLDAIRAAHRIIREVHWIRTLRATISENVVRRHQAADASERELGVALGPRHGAAAAGGDEQMLPLGSLFSHSVSVTSSFPPLRTKSSYRQAQQQHREHRRSISEQQQQAQAQQVPTITLVGDSGHTPSPSGAGVAAAAAAAAAPPHQHQHQRSISQINSSSTGSPLFLASPVVPNVGGTQQQQLASATAAAFQAPPGLPPPPLASQLTPHISEQHWDALKKAYSLREDVETFQRRIARLNWTSEDGVVVNCVEVRFPKLEATTLVAGRCIRESCCQFGSCSTFINFLKRMAIDGIKKRFLVHHRAALIISRVDDPIPPQVTAGWREGDVLCGVNATAMDYVHYLQQQQQRGDSAAGAAPMQQDPNVASMIAAARAAAASSSGGSASGVTDFVAAPPMVQGMSFYSFLEWACYGGSKECLVPVPGSQTTPAAGTAAGVKEQQQQQQQQQQASIQMIPVANGKIHIRIVPYASAASAALHGQGGGGNSGGNGGASSDPFFTAASVSDFSGASQRLLGGGKNPTAASSSVLVGGGNSSASHQHQQQQPSSVFNDIARLPLAAAASMAMLNSAGANSSSSGAAAASNMPSLSNSVSQFLPAAINHHASSGVPTSNSSSPLLIQASVSDQDGGGGGGGAGGVSVLRPVGFTIETKEILPYDIVEPPRVMKQLDEKTVFSVRDNAARPIIQAFTAVQQLLAPFVDEQWTAPVFDATAAFQLEIGNPGATISAIDQATRRIVDAILDSAANCLARSGLDKQATAHGRGKEVAEKMVQHVLPWAPGTEHSVFVEELGGYLFHEDPATVLLAALTSTSGKLSKPSGNGVLQSVRREAAVRKRALVAAQEKQAAQEEQAAQQQQQQQAQALAQQSNSPSTTSLQQQTVGDFVKIVETTDSLAASDFSPPSTVAAGDQQQQQQQQQERKDERPSEQHDGGNAPSAAAAPASTDATSSSTPPKARSEASNSERGDPLGDTARFNARAPSQSSGGSIRLQNELSPNGDFEADDAAGGGFDLEGDDLGDEQISPTLELGDLDDDDDMAAAGPKSKRKLNDNSKQQQQQQHQKQKQRSSGSKAAGDSGAAGAAAGGAGAAADSAGGGGGSEQDGDTSTTAGDHDFSITEVIRFDTAALPTEGLSAKMFDSDSVARRVLRESNEGGVSWAGPGYTVLLPYAAPFAALRHLYCQGDETSFLDSLRRCAEFAPQGGKSNSKFFTSVDNRFVIKQVSKAEFYSLRTLWPRYFKFMAGHYEDHGSSSSSGAKRSAAPPAALRCAFCKIFALFQIESGLFSFKRSFILMEKLFDVSAVTRVYDLKGLEMRPEEEAERLDAENNNDSSNQQQQQDSKDGATAGSNGDGHNGAAAAAAAAAAAGQQHMLGPDGAAGGLFSQPAMLSGAEVTRRDADLMREIETEGGFYYCRTDVYRAFVEMLDSNVNVLDNAGVMDYSLIVAIDDTKRTMTVGIIDYMRLFSRDKEIEVAWKEFVKGYSTVKDPLKYRARFSSALKHYFCAMPTRETRIVTQQQQQQQAAMPAAAMGQKETATKSQFDAGRS